jgi:hypothetical protein
MRSHDSSPVFLTGYPKSGTTLLLSLLDGHTELCVLPREAKFFLNAREELEADKEHRVMRFIERSFLQPQFGVSDAPEVSESKDEYRAALMKRWQVENYSMSEFLSAAVLAYGDVSGQVNRKWWVEKTPKTERYGELLSKWYPGMRMIYIVRDPRANYSAMKRWLTKDGSSIHISLFAHGWDASLAQNEKNRELCPVLTLRYEDLVYDTARCLERICQFLEISFRDSLLTPTLGGKAFQGNSIYGDRFAGISQSSTDRWRHEITPSEVGQIQSLLGNRMRQYGYELEPAGADARSSVPRIVEAHALKRMYDLYFSLPEGAKTAYRRLKQVVPLT